MGCCNAPGLMPLDEAMTQLLTAVTPLQQTEQITLEQSLDRILAEDIIAPINVPGHDNSAMDGYAIRIEDVTDSNQLTLIGKSFAGQPFDGELEAGQCVRIMTGATIPKGADTVVMQEDTSADDDRITLQASPKAGAHIRRAGEDIREGNIVLNKGKRLSPADIGLLASLGKAELQVYRRLRIALFSTGDELRLPGQPLEPGCIYDSNRFVVNAMLQRLGIDIVNLGILPDDKDALRTAFIDAASSCDAIITSGGVSVGEADYTKDILDELGRVNFWKVAIKPGKPFAFGYVDKAVFFGLPGNPVSAAVTFHQLALPAILKMAGELVEPPKTVRAVTEHRLRKHPGRTDFQRGTATQLDDGSWVVCDTGSQGSGMLSSMVKSNCYIRLASEVGDVEAGCEVEVLPYDRWIC